MFDNWPELCLISKKCWKNLPSTFCLLFDLTFFLPWSFLLFLISFSKSKKYIPDKKTFVVFDYGTGKKTLIVDAKKKRNILKVKNRYAKIWYKNFAPLFWKWWKFPTLKKGNDIKRFLKIYNSHNRWWFLSWKKRLKFKNDKKSSTILIAWYKKH